MMPWRMWLIVVGVLLTGTGGVGMAGPLIVAHRAGNLNWPENTICGFAAARQAGVDAIELDVQVSKDGVPVVYHPDDLGQWTTTKGMVADHTWAELRQLDVAKGFKGAVPFDCAPEERKIPSLAQVLERIPETPLILDFKSLPATPLVEAIVKVIPPTEWRRITVYSTQAEHLEAMKAHRPDAVLFENRATTFARLVKVKAGEDCALPNAAPWIGFELRRALDECERFKLGSNCVTLPPQQMWTPESTHCARRMVRGAKLAFFGINTVADYTLAAKLGADAVYTDDPKLLVGARRKR
ncbi:MAG: glycerophosphodiester phosphodiesterase [Deltaproteobacteria bacterium]|nr:glycerophosphodiester phosphodiesterase [Deltaproteobacteria bacterium]